MIKNREFISLKYHPVTSLKKNKILLLVPDLKLPGGVAGYYNTLKLDTTSNISYFFVNTFESQSLLRTLFRLLSNYCRFAYKIIVGQYKIIHINPSLTYKSFYRDSLFIFISRILNRRTLVFFRGWLEDFENKIKESKIKKIIFKYSYAKADKFIVLSGLFKNKLIELGVSPEKEFFIETTVADTSYLNEFSLEKKILSYSDEIHFLFLSRIVKTKGIYIAIDAYRNFLQKFPGRASTLTIAGDGPELQAVKRYVTELKIPNINFTGFVSGDKKKKILLESHILLFPSYTEGLPNAILEGMLYGMPVISRDTGGIPDIIHQNINGFLTKSLQPEVFTDFLSILCTDNILYKKMATINHQIAVKNFTREIVRERILKIYETF